MWAITLRTRIKNAFRSIRFKFILAYLLIMIIAFTAVDFAVIQLVGANVLKRTEGEKLALLRAQSDKFDSAAQSEDTYNMYISAREFADNYNCRVIFADSDRRIRVDTYSALTGSELDVPIKIGGFASDTFRADKYPAYSYSDSEYIFMCVYTNEYLSVVCIYSADDAMNDVYKVCVRLLYITLSVMACAIVLGLLITRKFTRPVNELGEAIATLSQGDFSVRVREDGNDEFTDLAHAFNEMTGRMETLDRSRNQFVSNASHELKTPLATIKILVESLLYSETYDEGMSKEFLGDVDKEIDRLNAVVVDLLTLVGMDSGETKLNVAEMSLSSLVREEVKRLSPLARERGIELELNLRDEVTVSGDATKLSQVFYNLIDNAIKYTPRGEGVKVEVLRMNKNAVVRVKDNGIGIPESDLKHIFDRFYRVDKARSRETGGTGLGLSIVKQIILAHGGTINVTSKVDNGSVFTVQLPLHSKPAGTGA